MAKQQRDPDEVRQTEQIGVRISEGLLRRLRQIGKTEDRKFTTVARLLMERGLAAYDRDQRLVEPGRQ